MASSNATQTASTVDPPPHYADNPSAFPTEGGCCCGHVRYRVEREPMAVHCCHCTACQRETGSAFTIGLILEATAVTILPAAPPTVPSHRGAPDVFPPAGPPLPAPPAVEAKSDHNGLVADAQDSPTTLLRAPIPQESGAPQTVSRCPRCYTAVWTEYAAFGPAVRFVRGGTLDRPWLVQPDVVLYARSKRPFVEVAGPGIAPFEEYYDRGEAWRPESLERWARLVPEITRYREGLERVD